MDWLWSEDGLWWYWLMVRLLVLWLFVWWHLPFVFWFLKFVSLNDFLRFKPFLDQMALRGNTPSDQTFFYGNFQGNIIGAQNPILGDNASDGSDQREDTIG